MSLELLWHVVEKKEELVIEILRIGEPMKDQVERRKLRHRGLPEMHAQLIRPPGEQGCNRNLPQREVHPTPSLVPVRQGTGIVRQGTGIVRQGTGGGAR